MSEIDELTASGEVPDDLGKLLRLRFPEVLPETGHGRASFAQLSEADRVEANEIIRNFYLARNFLTPREGTLQNSTALYGFTELEAQLEKRGDVIWVGEGMALLKGDFLSVKLALERAWRIVAVTRFESVEVEGPEIWEPSLARNSGHLADFPHESVFTFGAKSQGPSRKAVGAFFAKKSGKDSSYLEESFLENLRLLGFNQSSVCTVCYRVAVEADWLDGKIVTIQNRVFRNEGSKSLSRLMSFTVRDVVSFGSEVKVETDVNLFAEDFSSLCDELGLRFAVETASDPFFGKATGKLAFQAALGLKREFKVFDKNSSQSFAVASANFHRDTFANRFGWNEDGLSDGLHSGCFGVGFERLTLGLFLCLGPEVSRWPRSVRARLGLD